jgi:hypothetical protein
VIIIDRKSRLAQCGSGLRFLEEAVKRGEAQVSGVIEIADSHPRELARLLLHFDHRVDVYVVGGGDASLPGKVDDLLHRHFRYKAIQVVGVVFADYDEHLRPLIVKPVEKDVTDRTTPAVRYGYVAEEGFRFAVEHAVRDSLPPIASEVDAPLRFLILEEAHEIARSQLHEIAVRSPEIV